MRKIRDVLRLKLEARLSHERIAASLSIFKGVVAKYVSLASVAGLDWATVQTLSDTALERRVVQGRLDRPTHYVLPDYGRARQELRRKGMTLMLLWEEYVAAHPGQPPTATASSANGIGATPKWVAMTFALTPGFS
ncbi:hypothetical protein ABL841_20490 [Variovorax paradoxus]|uniref:hypothetical protein n=1 Tax=Variovorax paradoxus TaxID=34073 RepID=UPI0009B7E4EB|nr:hypothetical protein [Variovorax paradoxus]